MGYSLCMHFHLSVFWSGFLQNSAQNNFFVEWILTCFLEFFLEYLVSFGAVSCKNDFCMAISFA